MVVAARIAWARNLIRQGAPAHISVGSAATGGRGKAKIVIEHAGAPTSTMARVMLIEALDTIARRAALAVTVDRGHKHSMGSSEICLWLTAPVAADGWDAWPTDGPDGGDNNDPGGGNDGGPSGNRPRRGRSPPADSAIDPWQTTGADPWAGSNPRSPASKVPRQRATATPHAVRVVCNWDAWRPTTSSVTPDPPYFRGPRVLPPARTGTPPLLVAAGSDGGFVATGSWEPPERDDDSITMLTGMAAATCVAGATMVSGEYDTVGCLTEEPSCITNSGGQVIAEKNSALIVWEGESLCNLRHARQMNADAVIASLKEQCADTSWQLHTGDIVYEDVSRWPHRVIRMGWGQYEREVRIIRLTEDENSWESGRWCDTSRLFKLEVNDNLEVMESVVDASADRQIIPAGTKCRFFRWDPDGDPVLRFDGKSYCIFIHDLDKLSLI